MLDGTTLLGERLVVQFARGSRRNEDMNRQERAPPRPRRTPFRMQISGLPVETSWQVCCLFGSELVMRCLPSTRISKTLHGNLVPMSCTPKLVVIEMGKGNMALLFDIEELHTNSGNSFVEFETAADMNSAVSKLNNTEFKGQTVRCMADVSSASSSGRCNTILTVHSNKTSAHATAIVPAPAPHAVAITHQAIRATMMTAEDTHLDLHVTTVVALHLLAAASTTTTLAAAIHPLAVDPYAESQ